MKLREYNALAHNFAASFASGIGLLVGHCENRVFEEAWARPDGVIEIDFLTGRCPPGCTFQLRRAVHLYTEALPDFCVQHGADVGDMTDFKVRFYSASALECGFTVEIILSNGRRSSIDYLGQVGRRARMLDSLGRLRKQPAAFVQSELPDPPSD